MQKNNFKFSWPVIGNAHIIEFLEKTIAKEDMNGSYIFSGPDNLGKATTAINFAQILLCQNRQTGKNLPCGECPTCQHFRAYKKSEETNDNSDSEQDNLIYAHSDFHFIKKDKDKKNIAIEQIRDFIRTLNMSSFLNSYKIGIIKQADYLSNEASNALLKTLEEPKDKVIIVLVTQDVNKINPTIVSRSKVLNFHPVPADVIYDYLLEAGASRNEAKNFSRLSLGRPALALKFFEDKDYYRHYQEKMEIFINFFSQDANHRMLAINGFFNKNIVGQELVKRTKRILEIWQSATRDLLFLEYNNEDIVRNWFVVNELKRAKLNLPVSRLLTGFELIHSSQEMLEANVNPKLVLENLVINF